MTRYGASRQDDQGDQEAAELQRQITRRAIQLGTMRMRALIAEERRIMRAMGRSRLAGGPVSRQDYVSSILCLERAQRAHAKHRELFGEEHARCPWMNWQPLCGTGAEIEYR